MCHHDDPVFIFKGFAASRIILESTKRALPIADFINNYFSRFSEIINEHTIESLNHAVEVGCYTKKYAKIYIYDLIKINCFFF